MAHREKYADLPDFLHNSPYLPVGAPAYEDKGDPNVRPKPSPAQILSSKPARTIGLLVFFIIGLLLVKNRLRDTHLSARLFGPRCYFSEPVEINKNVPEVSDWSKYAYVQYATNRDYLCNSIMIFETLHIFGSKAGRVLMYPDTWRLGDFRNEVETRLLLKAKNEYNVALIPVEIQHQKLAYYSGPNWADSYTKLLAFNQTQYSRLLVLDSDSTLLQPLDELFFLPPAPVISPHAYWLSKSTLSSHIMLITPSSSTFSRVQKAIKKGRFGFYDMEIVNKLFGSSCLVIPHRKYALLSGEFRNEDHEAYLGKGEKWTPDEVIEEAKLLHFSDHPLQKPWEASRVDIDNMKPECVLEGGAGARQWDCRAREIWLDLYDDFRSRRKSICELEKNHPHQ